MKHAVIIFCLLVFGVSFSSFSQNQSWGLKIGGNLAKPTNFTGAGTFGASPGFEAGIVYKYQLSEELMFQIEPGFTQKAYKDRGFNFADASGNTVYSSDVRYSFNYLSLPVLLNYYFVTNDKFKVGLHTGLVGNLTLFGRVRYQIPTSGTIVKNSNTSSLATLMIELPLGLEFNFKMTENWWLGVSPRFNLGLTSFGKDQSAMTSKFNSFNLLVSVVKAF